MEILYIILLVWFFGGTISSWFIFGIPESISATYYLLVSRHPSLGILFTIWMFGLMFLTAPLLLSILEGEMYQVLGLTTAGGLGVVGAAPLFKDVSQKTSHFLGAAISAVSLLILSFTSLYWGLPLLVLIVFWFIQKCTKIKDTLYWMEYGIFILGFLYIYINLEKIW